MAERRLTGAEIDEIVFGTREIATLENARFATDNHGSWRPYRGVARRARQLAKGGLLKEAGTAVMWPHVLYVITDEGRVVLERTITDTSGDPNHG